MPRFGRPRTNTGDSSDFQFSDQAPPSSSSEPVSGFAASAAAGGVATSMGKSSSRPPTGGAGAQSSGEGGGVSSSSGRGYRKQKSITSGISTLFRRQPSPDFPEEALAVPPNFTASRDPTGVHASDTSAGYNTMEGTSIAIGPSSDVGDTTSASSSNSIMKKMKGSSKSKGNRGRSYSGSNGGGSVRPNSSRQASPAASRPLSRSRSRSKGTSRSTAPSAQYSATQRQLLHGVPPEFASNGVGGGGYDATSQVGQGNQSSSLAGYSQPIGQGQYTRQGMQSNQGHNQSRAELQNTALSTSMSGGATNTLSGANTPSREFTPNNPSSSRDRASSLQNQSALSYGQSEEDLSYNPSTNYHDTYDRTATSETDGGESYESNRGRKARRGASGRDDDAGRSTSARASSRGRSNSGGRRGTSPRSALTSNPGQQQLRLPRRYRGFSTSISSLFLDESIVCGALSCCGLLLSSRTEHLLNERNLKRGLTRRGAGGAAGRGKEGGKRAPSRILGIVWVITILGVLSTYAIWGFENQGEYEEWYDGEWEEYNDDGGNNNGANYNNDDGNNDQVNYNQNDDGNQNYNRNDDGGNQGNDDYNRDQADDANANNGDDAVQADDGAANDDAANQQADDAANRRLNKLQKTKSRMSNKARMWNRAVESYESSQESSQEKHPFVGIMKLRDHKEHIFDPACHLISNAYSNLMSQFDADEYHPKPLQPKPRHLQHPNQPQSHPTQRLLEDIDNSAYDQGQQVRTIIIVLFLFLLGVIGRRRRMRTRFAILRSRAQDDHLYYASILTKHGSGTSGSLATPDNTVMENFHEREDKYDGACSHTLFGCYPVDTQTANYADYNNEEESEDDETVSTAGTNASRKKLRRGGDFMSRTLTTMFNCCCGKLCQCWCQLFSICALAQEAREARLLLPPSMQRIDLITHQPFHEYAKDVNNVRRRFMEHANRTWVQHYAALSHLSRYILLGFLLITGFVVMTMLLHPMGGFDWGDALVLIATFTQSFLVLVIVFGIFHRSDLSFDAVVKFFAVGFCICVPVGFVLEGILINGLFSLLYLVYYLLHWIGGDNFDIWYGENYRILSILGELINAYFIAALVEELCKYYGFRFVEHPDLLFLTGLDRTAKQAKRSGGLDSYKYDSQLVSSFSRSMESDGESVDSRGRKKRSKRRDRMMKGYSLDHEEEEEEPDLRTLQQQSAAITTGMISVAVGLACAENFMYVFFLGGTGGDIGTVTVELSILIFRSFFPVHALSAAMQSINMIRKFIEVKHGGERHIGVGRILFPAILLHGTFDAILMCVNAFIEASWEWYYENGGGDDDATFEYPYNALAVNLIAALGIIGVMAASFGWYSYQNKLQMLRLARFDMKNRSKTGRGGFNAPNLV